MNKKLLTLGLSALLLTGCGASTSSSKASSDFEPISIKHIYGTTKIESKPERVATVGWENGDTPLALGVTPVGVSRSNYGKETKNHLHNWTDKAFKELGENKPNVFDDTDGFDYEAIADSNPDVILASYSGMTKEDYNKLSEIAPVVPFKTTAWSTTWRDQTIENATGMGMKKEGEAKVKEVEKLISDKVSKVSSLKNKTAAFVSMDTSDLSKFYIYLSNDPRAAYLNDLGLKESESIKKLANGSKEFYIQVSREKANELKDVDILVMYGDESMLKDLQKDAILKNVPAIKNGAVVFMDANSDLAAGATPSILSIPYNIDTYLNLLDKAAKRVK